MSDALPALLADPVLRWALLLLVPLVLVSATSFVKISVVFAALRNALGAPDLPSTLVITALTLALTIVVMAPTARAVEAAVAPALAASAQRGDALGAGELWQRGAPPVRAFLARNAGTEERALFMDLASRRGDGADPESLEVLWPAFVLTELAEAFQMAVLVLLPFVIIDLVLANVLLAVGLTTLPPAAVGLPLKLLLFVGVDGFRVLTEALVGGYA